MLQFLSFCIWLIEITKLSSRFICFVPCIRNSVWGVEHGLQVKSARSSASACSSAHTGVQLSTVGSLLPCGLLGSSSCGQPGQQMLLSSGPCCRTLSFLRFLKCTIWLPFFLLIFSWWLSPTLYVLVYVQVDLKQLMLRVVLEHSFLSVESKAHLITASQLALSISSLCLHHAGIRWVPLLTQKLYGFWGCKLWFSHQCFIHRPIPPASPASCSFFFCLFIWFGWDRRALHSLDWPRTGCVNQVGLELVILLLLTLRC